MPRASQTSHIELTSIQRRWVIEQVSGLSGVVEIREPDEPEPTLDVYVSNLNSPAAQFVFALSAMLAVDRHKAFLRLRVKPATELLEIATPQDRPPRIAGAQVRSGARRR